MKQNKVFQRVTAMLLCAVMLVGFLPAAVFAATFDTSVSGDYYTVISHDEYALAPGAVETEMVLNNASGSDRKVVHVIEVDPNETAVEVLPGYYGIDKLDPDNLADPTHWETATVTKVADYYQNTLGYNVVGAMNTSLAYDCNAPYDIMVYNGVVLADPSIHTGTAQTYLAVLKNDDGTVTFDLRSASEKLTGEEWQAVSTNFGWLVKDGKLTTTSVERTSSDASRSMLGIKADGTLVICQVDGRNAPTSTGLSNYEMGELMLSLGCVWAVNGDGGGSSSFVTKRAGSDELVMRSIPSDGAERPTINSIIVVSKVTEASGVFDYAILDTAMDYVAPGASIALSASGVDTNGFPVDVPADVSWQMKAGSGGSVSGGVFTAGTETGEATVQMVCGGNVVGEKTLNIVHPNTFGFGEESTVLPYGKSMALAVNGSYGADNWPVCIDGAYTLSLSDADAAVLSGNVLTAPAEGDKTGVEITATYTPDPTVTAVLSVAFGKGSEILFDFENGEEQDFMGVDEALAWCTANGITGTIFSDGNFSEDADNFTFLSTVDNGGQVKHGNGSLGVTLDYTDAQFASWSYNMFFYTGGRRVLRDTANGQNATTLGAWVYIPEGAAGVAMQLTAAVTKADGEAPYTTQMHYYFTTVSGEKKLLNAMTEADIPASRWVYATVDLTAYPYVALLDAVEDADLKRNPSFTRYYVKPTAPAMLTFYFDDFTLDYSSAVEDRILPTISNICYADADTSVTLENGAAISGNTISFSANVADANLNAASGRILVDGNAVEASVSNGVLSCGDVTLTAGTHTVSFEIEDGLGNLARVQRTFTIAGTAAITLGGHNDSGKPAEYDSVYYVDIQAADASDVDGLTAVLKLQTANNWEPAGITAAQGYKVTACTVNEKSNELTLTLVREEGTVLTGPATLASIPVRVWSWHGVNHVTGAAIAPATQFATGYCPIVTIDCEVVMGRADYAGGAFGAFGGSFSTATNLNDNANPWHAHDSELTVLEKDATCTEDGCTGRTYCQTCQSVVEWGTSVPATGHSYMLVDNVYRCACGELFSGEMDGLVYVDGVVANGWFGESYYVDGVVLTGIQVIDGYYYDLGEDGVCKNQTKLTGLFRMDGNTYYAIAGQLVGDWQMIGDAWYYFDPVTFIGANGTMKMDVTYHFTDGKLDSGIWYEVSGQYRYWYGPDYYRQSWAVIDGDSYYFGKTGYRYTGYNAICPNLNSRDPIYQLYLFDEKGVSQGLINESGLYDADGDLYYLDEGTCLYAKLVEVDGDYYYIASSYKAVKNVTRYIAADCTNGLVEAGYYTFDADGKMVIEEADETKNGIIDGYYYVDGEIAKIGLFKLDGNYYYASTTNGKLAVNVTRYVAADCIDASASDMKAGYYTFGADYKMVIEEPEQPTEPETTEPTEPMPSEPEETRNGIIDGYYYVDGEIAKIGLFKLDGNYYYASTTNGKLAVSITRYVAADCIDASASDMKAGYYTFGADYKMVIEEVDESKNGIIDGYYYVDGEIAKIGLFKLDGNYYYASTTNGKLAVSITRYVAADCIDASASDMKAGYYTFGADYKMVIEEVDERKNGIIDGYYYMNGEIAKIGLFKLDGNYYYASTTNGKLAVNVTRYVARDCIHSSASDMKAGYYTFDAEGKMVIG